jgi:hypothetical protein
MKRSELEHILRASKTLTGQTEFIVIGSQSILGRFPDAPCELRQSMEADLYPRYKPELSSEIEGSLGRYSQFDSTFGYWADGVSPDTANLPPRWEDRLIPLSNQNTDGAIGWCLEPHDLAFSKLAARREKDLAFVRGLLKHRMIARTELLRRIESSPDAILKTQLTETLSLCLRCT